MSETLRAEDLSPIPEDEIAAEEDAWLTRLQKHVRASDHVVRLGEAAHAEETDHIVFRDAFGHWQAGRYIGDIAFEGRRLEIRPRFKAEVLELWLQEALNLVVVPETAGRMESRSFIAWLLSIVWCRSVDLASRHGPPSLRRDQIHTGAFVRGRMDVRRTSRLLAGGDPRVVSITSNRSLDNDVSRTLVAAERSLTNHIGHNRWRTQRVKEVMPQLVGAVGARPRLPSERRLAQIRYSPITLPFKRAAELSWKIARQQGFVSAEEGRSEGLLLDVAELWELFVMNTARRAFPGLSVEHATKAGRADYLLRSAASETRRLGRLKPDVLIWHGEDLVAVLDAKYKRLVDRWPDRPDGIDRADLYQLASYAARFDPSGRAVGMLLYPRDDSQTSLAAAELYGPWTAETGTMFEFRRLAVIPADARAELTEALGALDRNPP